MIRQDLINMNYSEILAKYELDEDAYDIDDYQEDITKSFNSEPTYLEAISKWR